MKKYRQGYCISFITIILYFCFSINFLFAIEQIPNTSGNIARIDNPEYTNIITKYTKAIVLIGTYDSNGKLNGLGSGFIVRNNGIIVTNLHVIRNSKSVVIKTLSNEIYEVSGVIDFDEKRDIAVIKINASNLPFVKIGDSDKIKIGEKIIAIGNPEGLTNTVSDGIISSIRVFEGVKLIQMTAPISHGSSGGALINLDGDVIGITSNLIENGQNLNFAIPINYAIPLINNEVKYSLADIPRSENIKENQTEKPKIENNPDVLSKINSFFQESGLKFQKIQDNTWTVAFAGKNKKDILVVIFYNKDNNEVFYTSEVAKEKDMDLNAEFLYKLIEINGIYLNVKFCMNDGFLIVRAEDSADTITQISLVRNINQVAAIIEENWQLLSKHIK